MADSNPICLTDSEVLLHAYPFPGQAKVLIFIEADSEVTHVLMLDAEAARGLVVGLLEALDVAASADGPDDLAVLDGSDDDRERG
jgi:hypothetical protein